MKGESILRVSRIYLNLESSNGKLDPVSRGNIIEKQKKKKLKKLHHDT